MTIQKRITQTIIALTKLQAVIEDGDGASMFEAETNALSQMDELTGDLEGQSFGKVYKDATGKSEYYWVLRHAINERGETRDRLAFEIGAFRDVSEGAELVDYLNEQWPEH